MSTQQFCNRLDILTSSIILFKYLILRYAEQLSIDDEVLVNENNTLTPTKVINTTSLMMEGNYYYQISSVPEIFN